MSQATLQRQRQEQLLYKIQYLKLRRVLELNNKLKQELNRERITASNACLNIINYTTSTKDFAIPTIWGYPEQNTNPYNNNMTKQFNQNGYYRGANGGGFNQEDGCCTIA